PLHSTSRPPSSLFSFPPTAPTQLYTLSLHDALPISDRVPLSSLMRSPSSLFFCSNSVSAFSTARCAMVKASLAASRACLCLSLRSEEHTSELQSRGHLVCRLLLEKKNKKL